MYKIFRDERGTAAIEYSLIITFIGLVMAVALHVLGANLVDAFSSVNGAFSPVQVIEDPRN
jgi:Flp pilus assembly pilin Flp